MIAINPRKDPELAEAEDPERFTALYDPDTVHPARLAEPPRPALAVAETETERECAPLYAESEKRRAASPLSADMVKRLADRAEQNARKRRG